MFQKLIAPTEEPQSAMAKELTVFQEKAADHLFHCANGIQLQEPMDQWVFQELIVKPHHFQLVTNSQLSTANQSALRVSQLDALKLEPQFHSQWETGTGETDLRVQELIKIELSNEQENEKQKVLMN